MPTAATGRKIEPYKIIGSGGMWGVTFGKGGKVPEELQGGYTNEALALKAIEDHISKSTKEYKTWKKTDAASKSN